MPIISGGGGGAAFNGGTITEPVVVNESDPLEFTFFEGKYTGAANLDGLIGYSDSGSGNVQCRLDFTAGGTEAASVNVYDDSLDGVMALNSQFGLTVTGRSTLGATATLIDAKLRGSASSFQALAGGGILTAPPAPATATLSTGTGAQLSTTRDVHSYTPVTFNPTAGAAATCAVAISKDGTNYTALWTETEPAGIAFDGTIHGINVYVPAAWKLRLTVTNATIGTTTYY